MKKTLLIALFAVMTVACGSEDYPHPCDQAYDDCVIDAVVGCEAPGFGEQCLDHSFATCEQALTVCMEGDGRAP